MPADLVTEQWSRSPADARAASRGCKFNVERGSHAVWWVERYCRLYEGENAGEPLHLHGCRTCGGKPKQYDVWDDKTAAAFEKRAAKHNACVAAGHEMDWQYEHVMRLFGWEKWSERFERWVRRFNRSGVFIAKKNKKSPTLAAVALYVFCGDGEPGQKVYLCAKDGAQAREIAGKHIVEMFEQSAELSDICTLNKSLMQLTHTASRSIIKPISSADAKTQKSKEGLNGSSFVDETHVVDAEFIARIIRAGISRSEPLHCEYSTAGNDPQSYGYAQFEYGLKVNSGEIDDDGYLAMIYAAPQTLSDDDLAADPCKYGRMANPAWGHTVNEEEFLEDYKRSRDSIQTLADFKMYRLNIWQHSSNPWLRIGDWDACRRDFAESDLLGRECWGALDLAKVHDTTALPLIFPEGNGEYRIHVYYWLPEETAKKLARDVGYLEWARLGLVTLTPGNTTDQRFVRSAINEIRKQFQLKKLVYDDYYAAELITYLTEEDGMDVRDIENFPQTSAHFAGPTAAFERAVIDGKLHHNGNPMLRWQAMNVRVHPDGNGNNRPSKKHANAKATIDGIVAGIMALAACQEAEAKASKGYRITII